MKKAFLLLSLILLIPFSVRAKEKAGFSVSPPSFEINANSGDEIDNTIKIENLSPFPLTIQVKSQNFVAYGEGGQVNLTEENSSFSISKWIYLDKDSLTIAPNSFALSNFTIKIPREAEPGSHYGAVVFSTVPDDTAQGSGAALAQEIGSLILIKLPGDVFEQVKLVSFKPEKNIFNEGRIIFNTLLENSGNVHVKPYGFITVYNPIGKKITSIEVLGRNILPGSKRLFIDETKFVKTGYYKADLNLIYSGGGGLIKAETTFFAVNQKELTRYLIIAGAILVFYLLFRKRINRAFKVLLRG